MSIAQIDLLIPRDVADHLPPTWKGGKWAKLVAAKQGRMADLLDGFKPSPAVPGDESAALARTIVRAVKIAYLGGVFNAGKARCVAEAAALCSAADPWRKGTPTPEVVEARASLVAWACAGSRFSRDRVVAWATACNPQEAAPAQETKEAPAPEASGAQEAKGKEAPAKAKAKAPATKPKGKAKGKGG